MIPDSAQYGGPYPGGILFGGQSDKAFGGTIGNLSTIQNGDYKEFGPRIGFAWSPGDNWVLRGGFGIFDAPRDAENYTDGALGLGLNPHTVGNGAILRQFRVSTIGRAARGNHVVFPTVQTLSSLSEL